MALWRSKGARRDATRGTAPIEVRKSDALLFVQPGVVPGSALPLVTGTSGWTYQVGKAGFVSSRGESDGVHLYGNDGVAATPAAPVSPGGSLSRIDVIWVRHPAAGENSDTTSEPEFGVASGTPASTPVAPTIPTGALELARNTMTSAATSTASAGNSITQTAAVAALYGSKMFEYSLPSDSGGADATAWSTGIGALTWAGLRCKVSICGDVNTTVAGSRFTIQVRDGSATGTVLAAMNVVPPSAGGGGQITWSAWDTANPAPGRRQMFLVVTRNVGTGVGTLRSGFRVVVEVAA